jgi:hypothetical protein
MSPEAKELPAIFTVSKAARGHGTPRFSTASRSHVTSRVVVEALTATTLATRNSGQWSLRKRDRTGFEVVAGGCDGFEVTVDSCAQERDGRSRTTLERSVVDSMMAVAIK